MRINIPEKLEKYKNHIKDCSYQIVYSKQFSLFKIASSKKKDYYRELYICYNPYETSIILNINHFKADKDIYKMYPSSLKVDEKEIFAFMVFSTKASKLNLDEEYMIYNQRNNILESIKRINKKNQMNDEKILIEEYDPSINSTILLDEEFKKKSPVTYADRFNADQTQKLDEFLLKNGNKKINEANIEKDIKIKLRAVNSVRKKYKFVILITNINILKEHKIEKLDINFYDKNNKQTVELNQPILIKSKSQKEISFLVSKEVFKDFDMKNLKIKVII